MKQTGMLPFSLCLAFISLLLLTASSAWAGRLPEEFPEALEGMDIRDGYVPAGGFARAGTVHALQGTLVVVHRADQTAFAASQGDPIHENDELFTLTDSRCRIRFLSEDVVNMAPETRFSVERFMNRPERGEKTSLFGLLKGKAMFYALRLFRYRDARFQVETPTAVVGVRGTQFGVHVFELEGKRAGTRGVWVAERGPGLPVRLAQAGQDKFGFGTVVACGDGELDVKDRDTGRQIALVRPNEDFNTVTGQKTFDPQNRTLNGIAADTQVQEEGGAGEQLGQAGIGTQPQEGETLLTGEDTASTAPADVTDLTMDVTTQQTGDGTQRDEESPPRDYPVQHWGYFNGLLTADLSPGGYYRVVNLTNLDGTGTAQGRRLGVTVGSMEFDGAGAPGIKSITALTHEGKTVDSGLPIDVKWYEYGHNAWMVWGIWRQPIAMPTTDGGGDNFYFDYRGYLFAGDYTTDTQMSALTSLGTVTYSGDAWGKHRDQPAGQDMKGTFSAQVDFSSASIPDFDLSVSGDGHSVNIKDVKGDFTGSSSQFVMDTGTGSWHIDGSAGTKMDVRGSLYGDEAQAFGANWVITDGTTSAWGMCVGER